MGDDVRSNHFDIFPIIFTHPILLPRPAWLCAVETHFPRPEVAFFGLLPHWYAFLCCKAATFDLRLCIMACFKICLSSDWRQRVAFSRCRMIATRRKEEVSTFGIHILFQKLSTLEPIKSSVNLFRQWVWDLLQNMHTPRNLIEKDPCPRRNRPAQRVPGWWDHQVPQYCTPKAVTRLSKKGAKLGQPQNQAILKSKTLHLASKYQFGSLDIWVRGLEEVHPPSPRKVKTKVTNSGHPH